jgi:integrase
MSSLSVTLFTSKTLKNGEHPIMIRLIKDRKIKYHTLGHSCSKELWNFEKNIPKSKHPNFKELSILIEHKKSSLNRELIKIETNDEVLNIEELKNKIYKKNLPTSLLTYLKSLEANFIKAGKIGNSKMYYDLHRVLKLFLKDDDISISNISVSTLRKLEQYFQELKYRGNTMSVYFRTFRSTINKAISDGLLEEDKNPFKKFSFAHLKNETAKRAISKTEIKVLEALEITGNDKKKLAQDFFMWSYYTHGQNFKDFAELKGENIQIKDGKYIMIYFRSKTKKIFTIQLLPQAIEIYNRYYSGDSKQYIFPILDNKTHIKPLSINNRIKKVATQINAQLKIIAKEVGIETEITNYSSRHTFATSLKNSGVGTAYISQMMGHKTEAITQVYLDSFENEKLYEASLNL